VVAEMLPWAGRAAESWAVSQALATSLARFAEVRAARRSRRSKAAVVQVPYEVRAAAYANLRRATVQLRVDLAVLATGPTFRGALWTVPVQLRLLRLLPDRMGKALDAVVEIEGVGSDETIDLAEQLALRIGEATSAFPSGRRAERAAMKPTYEAGLAALDQALVAFVEGCRIDLASAPVTPDP
jgi:hypothetical protein